MPLVFDYARVSRRNHAKLKSSRRRTQSKHRCGGYSFSSRRQVAQKYSNLAELGVYIIQSIIGYQIIDLVWTILELSLAIS